jgi:hypothetical protein
MSTTPDTVPRFILMGAAKHLRHAVLPPSVRVCHDRSELESAIASATKRTTWVSFTRNSTDLLLEATTKHHPTPFCTSLTRTFGAGSTDSGVIANGRSGRLYCGCASSGS